MSRKAKAMAAVMAGVVGAFRPQEKRYGTRASRNALVRGIIADMRIKGVRQLSADRDTRRILDYIEAFKGYSLSEGLTEAEIREAVKLFADDAAGGSLKVVLLPEESRDGKAHWF